MKIKLLQIYLILSIIVLGVGCSTSEVDDPTTIDPPGKDVPEPLKIGNSLSLSKVTTDKMKYIKSVGVDYIEVAGLGGFFDTNRSFTKSDNEATRLMNAAKQAADEGNVKIWSIHMPFSEQMDLSTINEEDRKRVVNGHIKLLSFIKILKPKIVLFHPSYYLDPPGQRELRKSQFIKSAKELDEAVREIGATIVIENMLGPELMSGERERPLLRTVEETVEIFNRLPKTVHLAVDLNHIQNPENLLRAMGKRVKSIHVADGTGRAENHWFPCSGAGQNNWKEILKALHEIGYDGPFMYEVNKEYYNDDEKNLVDCYNSLYNEFIKSLN